jgi:hypothetical protein
MSNTANTAKWIGTLLLHAPVYLVTSYVMRSLVGGSYSLLVKAGANLPPTLVLRHYLFVSILDGFLAGLLGVFTVRAMMLLLTRIRVASGSAWKRPQAWTWVISTCWFAFGILAWAATHTQHSVLATSPGLRFSDPITVFFGSECDLSTVPLSRSAFDACMGQLTYTNPWLGTFGYSAAAFIPAGWSNRLKNSTDSAQHLEASTDEQGPVQQPQLGEVLK